MAPVLSKDFSSYGTPMHSLLKPGVSPPTQAGVDAHSTVRSFVAKPPAWNQASGTTTIAQNHSGLFWSSWISVKNTIPFRRTNLDRDEGLLQVIYAAQGELRAVRSPGFVQIIIYIKNVHAAASVITTLRQSLNDRYHPDGLDVEVHPLTSDEALEILNRATREMQTPRQPLTQTATAENPDRYSFDGQVLIHGCMTLNIQRSRGAASTALVEAVENAIRQQLAVFGIDARVIHLLEGVLAQSSRPLVPYIVQLRVHEHADLFVELFRRAALVSRLCGGIQVQVPGLQQPIILWAVNMEPKAITPVTRLNPLPEDTWTWTEADFFRWRQFGFVDMSHQLTHPALAGAQPGPHSGPPGAASPTHSNNFEGASASQHATPTQRAVSGQAQINNNNATSSSMRAHQPATPTIPPYMTNINDDLEAFSLDDDNGLANGFQGGHASGNNIIRRFLMDGSEVMFRALPGDMTVETFISFLNHFAPGQFRFVYVRKDFSTGKNVGYAFVDFISPMSVVTFLDYTLGELWPGSARKRVEMSFATVQGVEALIERFRNSVVMTEPEQHRPRLFYAHPDPLVGMEMPFPACDNQQKLWRSIHSAQDVGLFPNGKRQNFSRRGHFDPGNPRGELQRSYDRVCQENRMMRGMLRGGRRGMNA